MKATQSRRPAEMLYRAEPPPAWGRVSAPQGVHVEPRGGAAGVGAVVADLPAWLAAVDGDHAVPDVTEFHRVPRRHRRVAGTQACPSPVAAVGTSSRSTPREAATPWIVLWRLA
jgi:hypothetical protein